MKTVCRLAMIGGLALAALPTCGSAATSLDEAITQAAQAPGYLPKVRAIYKVLAARPIEDFPAAVDRINELKINSPVLSETIGYWIERDVAGAKAWLDAHLDKKAVYGPPFCFAWVRVDLAGFVDWLNSSARARGFAIHARGEMFEAFAREDPETAAEWSLRMPKPPSINHIYDEQRFFIEWAGQDPVAAGTRALAIPAGAVRLNALRGVMSGWSANDREAAARWAAAIEDPALRRECTATLESLDKIRQERGVETAPARPAAAPSELPPAPEMAAALNHPSEMHLQHDYFVLAQRLGPAATVLALESVWQQRERRVFKVFLGACSAWAEKDFPAFRTHVERMSDPETVAIARMALMKRWQRIDEPAALAWANQLPPAQRDSLLRSAKSFTPQPADPNQRLAKALAEPGHFGEAATIFADWAKQNPEAAAARALAFAREGERSMAVSGVLRGWVENDPGAALAWVLKLEAANRAEACGQLFEAWARRDLETALTTAQRLDGDLRPAALGSIVPVMLARDQDRALVLLETLPLHYAGQGYLSWGDRDPAAAVTAIMRRAATKPVLDQRVENPFDLTVYVEMIVRSWARRDLPAAAVFVMAQSGPVRDRVCSEIVEVWKKLAPQAAVEWIFTLPDFDDPMRRSALERAIGGWVDSSQQEAVAWVDGLTKDPKRDAAVAALGRAIMPHDANAALARLRTIRDPKQQREALYAAWIQWSAVGGQGPAVRWRDSASLSPAERQLLSTARSAIPAAAPTRKPRVRARRR